MSNAATVTMDRVELKVSDGTTMFAHIARPSQAVTNAPGMLVFQEAFGVNDHIRDICRRFADLGFTAIAPELYHRTGTGVELKYGDMDAVKPHSGAMTLEGTAADIQAAYGWLTNGAEIARDRIASIGFCQGGRTSYIANAHVPLGAAISFYGGRMGEMMQLIEKQHAPILMFWGGLDKNITPETRRPVADALTAAGKVHEQVVFSNAEHGFFCDARSSYNADAARQAWALSLEFLRVRKVLQ
jgi:carboxymethylenebutenolidase